MPPDHGHPGQGDTTRTTAHGHPERGDTKTATAHGHPRRGDTIQQPDTQFYPDFCAVVTRAQTRSADIAQQSEPPKGPRQRRKRRRLNSNDEASEGDEETYHPTEDQGSEELDEPTAWDALDGHAGYGGTPPAIEVDDPGELQLYEFDRDFPSNDDIPTTPAEAIQRDQDQQKLQATHMGMAQREHPPIRKLRQWLRHKKRLPAPGAVANDPYMTELRRNYNFFFIKDGITYRRSRQGHKDQRNPETWHQVLIPPKLVPAILRLLHVHPLSGHFGVSRTFEQARQRYYWPGMAADIKKAVLGCEACIKAKYRTPVKRFPLKQTSSQLPPRFTQFAADLVDMPTTQRGHRHILTLQELTTKWIEAWPLKSARIDDILYTLEQHVFPRYGTGFTLTTDNGRQFISTAMKEVAQRMGIFHHTTRVYEPHANPVERLHRSLGNLLRANTYQENAGADQWDRYLAYALGALNQSPDPSTGFSPFYLMYGQAPVTVADVYTATRPDMPRGTASELANTIYRRQQRSLDLARAQALRKHLVNKAAHDRRLKSCDFEINDWVYVHRPVNPKRLAEAGGRRKLLAYAEGPYQVTEVNTDRGYVKIARGSSRNRQTLTFTDESVSMDRLVKATDWDISALAPPLYWHPWPTGQGHQRHPTNYNRETPPPPFYAPGNTSSGPRPSRVSNSFPQTYTTPPPLITPRQTDNPLPTTWATPLPPQQTPHTPGITARAEEPEITSEAETPYDPELAPEEIQGSDDEQDDLEDGIHLALPITELPPILPMEQDHYPATRQQKRPHTELEEDQEENQPPPKKTVMAPPEPLQTATTQDETEPTNMDEVSAETQQTTPTNEEGPTETNQEGTSSEIPMEDTTTATGNNENPGTPETEETPRPDNHGQELDPTAIQALGMNPKSIAITTITTVAPTPEVQMETLIAPPQERDQTFYSYANLRLDHSATGALGLNPNLIEVIPVVTSRGPPRENDDWAKRRYNITPRRFTPSESPNSPTTTDPNCYDVTDSSSYDTTDSGNRIDNNDQNTTDPGRHTIKPTYAEIVRQNRTQNKGTPIKPGARLAPTPPRPKAPTLTGTRRTESISQRGAL
jgi:hypothetical protein